MTALALASAPLTLCLLALAVAEPTFPGDPGACQADHEDVGLLQTVRKTEVHKEVQVRSQLVKASQRAKACPSCSGGACDCSWATPAVCGGPGDGSCCFNCCCNTGPAPPPSAEESSTDNPCADTKPSSNPAFDNFPCVQDGVIKALEQAGANITEGYEGGLDVGDREPWNLTFVEGGLCPVNVHWHYGTEHLSAGEFDENGAGPYSPSEKDEGIRLGFQCHYYDANDPKFTTAYDWKHCVDMRVGETYEVHWPHSAAGACGTPFQYQTPFYDGVFCKAATVPLSPLENKVGVHSQVFVIVNDESYYNPDMIKGMIVDPSSGFGSDIAYYTGSTTGTSRNNEVCSAYSPITWQVDRKCHLISASSFDKMCADMMLQKDDMSGDLYPQMILTVMHPNPERGWA